MYLGLLQLSNIIHENPSNQEYVPTTVLLFLENEVKYVCYMFKFAHCMEIPVGSGQFFQ